MILFAQQIAVQRNSRLSDHVTKIVGSRNGKIPQTTILVHRRIKSEDPSFVPHFSLFFVPSVLLFAPKQRHTIAMATHTAEEFEGPPAPLHSLLYY